ncbi:helix-turn-helix domain-containing protein [Budviciaceae bacterium CWB-B4]|uniref:Helix-turn-helix domain-containing protein n=2 Tax=Limnobaculum xujianqingii TaxID=2738837 RepID=A0A9D7AM76_9GAMM|nr:helix-turn-helix domain-containing protein [Limnobaculum xujianqingii]MBK5075169.1 helix-turn-helix domain-containing protein [Limnobaculum xujianqingii]MBK5178483.1 helix-turn-helix domain-containing protein [Limnobaculum xujianqingii]
MSKNTDWPPSRIVGEIKIRGGTLRSLSRSAGLNPDSLRNALYRRCPKYEQIIADYLNVPANKIWPSRYTK